MARPDQKPAAGGHEVGVIARLTTQVLVEQQIGLVGAVGKVVDDQQTAAFRRDH